MHKAGCNAPENLVVGCKQNADLRAVSQICPLDAGDIFLTNHL
jgi:hypothetical protein